MEISKSKFYIIAAIFLIAVFLLTIKPLADYDTGYHLRTGEYVVVHKTVPLYDIFSYTAPNARWVAHYWLSDVIFYEIDHAFGNLGLIIFVSMIATLTYFIVLKLTWEKIGKKLLPLILFFVFSYLTLELWVVRPQIFTYLLAVLLVYILERWRRLKNNRLLYLLIPLFILWANLHAGVILGIAILALYAVHHGLTHWRQKREIIAPLLIFFASTASTLLNPNGYKLLAYGLIIRPAIEQMRVTEWLSIFEYMQRWQAKVFLALLVGALIFVWWFALRKKPKFLEIDWISLGLVTGAAIMPIVSVRHIAFFPIFALPVASEYLTKWFEEKEVVLERVRFAVPLTILIGLILIAGPALRLSGMPEVLMPPLPIGAADFILKNKIPGPMFNPEHYGGYLIWRLWPEYKVFLDGRSEIYMGTPNDDYQTILYQGPGWESLVNDKYKINFIVMTYPEFANSTGLALVRGIHKAGFVTVYYDDTALIFVRNSEQNKKLIGQFGYKLVDPFENIRAIPENKLPGAYGESLRALQNAPEALITRYIVEFLKIRLTQEGIPVPSK